MKSSLRYDGAVERNLSNAERRKKANIASPETMNGRTSKIANYNGKRLEVAKTMIGIRKDDDRYDARIAALIKEVK